MLGEGGGLNKKVTKTRCNLKLESYMTLIVFNGVFLHSAFTFYLIEHFIFQRNRSSISYFASTYILKLKQLSRHDKFILRRKFWTHKNRRQQFCSNHLMMKSVELIFAPCLCLLLVSKLGNKWKKRVKFSKLRIKVPMALILKALNSTHQSHQK